ncbi:hypothetical protein H0H93_012750, partial [Arthromyces matolae]
MSQSPSPSPPDSFDIAVTVTLSSTVPESTKKSNNKKTNTVKNKTETKNKQLKFKFSPASENYVDFMNAVLSSHSLSKFGPASLSARFPMRVYMPPTKKSDAVDIEKFSEYKNIIEIALSRSTLPKSMTVFISLDNIKAFGKKVKSSTGNNDDGVDISSESSSDTDQETTHVGDNLEQELGRLRGLLEDKYQNPNDAGYTYICDSGDRLPLTPFMMKEWARALFDHTASINMPPNSITFDPAYRGRSILTKSAAAAPTTSSNSHDGLAHVSSIFTSLTTLLSNPSSVLHSASLSLPAPRPITPTSVSTPPINTPSKLDRFLTYAETQLGVRQASSYAF